MEPNKRFHFSEDSYKLRSSLKNNEVKRSLSLDSARERKERKEKELYDSYKKELTDQRKRELVTGKRKLPSVSHDFSHLPLESVKEEREMSRSQSSAAAESRGGSPDRKNIQAPAATRIASSQFKRLLSRKTKFHKRHTYPKLYNSLNSWDRDPNRVVSFKKIARTVCLTLRWYRLHNFRWDWRIYIFVTFRNNCILGSDLSEG